MEEVYQQWKDQVEFITVYVREAHPTDDRGATETNRRAGIIIAQPTSLDERRAVAEKCTAALKIRMPMIVDEIDNRVAHQYDALPDRLYVIDRYGRIAYRGGPGPFGFNPSEMEQTLLLLLLEQQQQRSQE